MISRTGLGWGRCVVVSLAGVAAIAVPGRLSAGADSDDRNGFESTHLAVGRHLFEEETFGGNGRTCQTCHSRETGTVSPADAQERMARDPNDPLFRGDGSDDGAGNGADRMLTHATVLVGVTLADNVSLAADPKVRTAVVRRGIPSTINTPGLDAELMYDGRHRSLDEQARSAILGHAAATRPPTAKEIERIAEFERSRRFFSSSGLWNFAVTGRPPILPPGRTAAEKRGREFFDDVPVGKGSSKRGACAVCHSGPLLNETNEFIPAPPRRRGGRFQSILVSELNAMGNPLQEFVFRKPDGTTATILSPDPGRALVTGKLDLENLNAFKIPQLWGVADTAPYFHDSSAKTLEEVMLHYKKFFEIVTDPKIDGDPAIELTDQDQQDLVAYLKLLR